MEIRISNLPSSVFKFVREYKILSGIAFVIILIIILLAFKSRGAGNTETYTVSERKITEVVRVTGKVAPVEKVSLAFDKNGTVSKTYVKVGEKVTAGQVLATLDSGEVRASLAGAEADVMAEEAKAAEVARGARTEEIAVYEGKVKSANTALENAKRDLKNYMRDSVSKTEDAIRNKIDVSLFDNGESANPTIKIWTSDSTAERNINEERFSITEALNGWRKTVKLSPDDIEKISLETASVLYKSKNFLDNMWKIVNDLTPDSTGLSQSDIDGYRNTVSLALTQVNLAISTEATYDSVYKTAESALKVANDELALKNSKATSEEVRTQNAKLEKARANVLAIKSQYSNTVIVSPLSGVVTSMDAKVGEVFMAGASAVSVMTSNGFNIEARIPEVDIAKIAIGNKANITLDAYGKYEIFPATVISIDPAEVVYEGIPSYKVTLKFDNNDSRILSGMTSNIGIITKEKTALAVPLRFVYNSGALKKVKVFEKLNNDVSDKNTGKIVEKAVEIGITGADGYGEVKNGLRAGEMLSL